MTAAIHPPRTDRQFLDRIEADALAYGGDELLAEVRDEAAAWALEHDDAARWSVYLAVAWQLVDARRAELVGQMVPTPNGRVRVVTPARCPAGHSWDVRSPWVASWVGCRGRGEDGLRAHRGHHRWKCLLSNDDGAECGEIVLWPDVADGCSFVGIGEGEG